MQVAVFKNIREVIRAEKICGEIGVKVTVIPVPESISSECGMCLRLEGDTDSFENLMNMNSIQTKIYDKI